jgi:hypothetical protein
MYPQSDNVAAAQLAVDGKVEPKSRVRPSIWSLVRIDHTCFGRSGGFDPISLLLFHGVRLVELVKEF